MIKTVNDLIEALKVFDADMPVCIRKCDIDGYYSDWKVHTPNEFYPGGKVCLSSFEQMDDEVAKVWSSEKSR